MEGIDIPIGLFIAWVLLMSLFDKVEEWNDKRPIVIERRQRKETERYNSPEAVQERKARRAQEYRNYKRALRANRPMSSNGQSSSLDKVIYIWKVKDATMFGHPIYKIGITNRHLEDSRMYDVAYKNGQEVETILRSRVNGKASDLEARLLKLGLKPEGYDRLAGGSEYRALSTNEYNMAREMILDKTRKPKARWFDDNYEGLTKIWYPF